MNKTQLTNLVIIPTLEGIEMGGKDAVALMLVTGQVESAYHYISQLGGGPALSFWQIEPNTHRDVVDNYLIYRPKLTRTIKEVTGVDPLDIPDNRLIDNMSYACAIARICYYRHPFKIPSWEDLQGQWEVYKKYYNTRFGDTTEDEFFDAYVECKKYINKLSD